MTAALNDRQTQALEKLIIEVREKYDVSINDIRDLQLSFEEETRLGRGHFVRYSFIDSDYVVCGTCDVYGYPTLVVAEIFVVHNSEDDECSCAACLIPVWLDDLLEENDEMNK